MKVKNTIVAAVLSTVAATAYADQPMWSLDYRFDLLKESANTDRLNDKNKENKDLKFNTNLVRLGAAGKINDDLAYMFSYDLNDSDTAVANSNTTTRLNHANVSHTGFDNLTLTFGKQDFAIGGLENESKTQDEYLTSITNPGDTESYRSGIGARYEFGDHYVNLQIVNNQHGYDNHGKMAFGGKVGLNFADGLFSPYFSYHMDPRDEQSATASSIPNDASENESAANTAGTALIKSDFEYMAAGFQVAHSNLTFQFDYLSEVREAKTSAGKEDKDEALIFKAWYDIGEWRPGLKYTMNEREMDEGTAPASSYERDDIVLSVEHRPYSNTDFRWHVAYATSSTDYEAIPAASNGSTDQKFRNSSIILGLAGSFK